MNNRSHPNHENRQMIVLTVLNRRGGAPSGAAVVIVFGGMGVSTPIRNFKGFPTKIIIDYDFSSFV